MFLSKRELMEALGIVPCEHCGRARSLCREELPIPEFRDRRNTPAIDDAVFTRYQGETFGWKAGLPNAT